MAPAVGAEEAAPRLLRSLGLVRPLRRWLRGGARGWSEGPGALPSGHVAQLSDDRQLLPPARRDLQPRRPGLVEFSGTSFRMR